MNILCLGDLSLDHYIKQDKSFFGGCSLNVARQLYEVLDHKQTSLYVPIGNDENSKRAKAYLETLNIEVRYKPYSGVLPSQPIIVDEDGERHFEEYIDGVLPEFKVSDLGGFYFDSKDLIIFPYFKQVESMVSSLLKLNPKAKLACDFGNLSDYDGNLTPIREILPFLSYAQFSGTPACKIRDEFFSKAVLESGLIIVDTFGNQGARAYQKGRTFNSEAPQILQVTDTTGAGDAFMAHISYSLFVLGNDLEKASNFACEGGSKQVSHLGPGP
ncbi:MAG: sugar/nucleoside kinase (ribokinase family), partial [Bacteriovoracaceae bacterium]